MRRLRSARPSEVHTVTDSPAAQLIRYVLPDPPRCPVTRRRALEQKQHNLQKLPESI